MDHTNKAGETKLLKSCSLPLTGKQVVNRIITNLGVFDVVEGGLQVVELATDVTMDEVIQKTEANIVE
jgi:3-oxoacid CoA-transferase subunit B